MPSKKMIILGGGTAGWMAANVLNHQLQSQNVQITLVESPAIGTIGVGEGSTPHLKRFFDLLGVSEQEWMPKCHASYKNGISFIDWTEHLPSNRYFHPFPSIIDRQTAMAFLGSCMARHKGKNLVTNPDHYFLANVLSQQGMGPKTKPDKPPIPLNYAYHFDSSLVGLFLTELAVKNGVRHIQGTYTRAHLNPSNSNISAIELDDGSVHKADFFIDASGFSSHLLQKELKVGFDSFADNLFNDSAIAIPSPVASPLLAETKATALKYGWAWHIPLTTRTGNGYVFSQKYCSFEQAETELRQHIGVSAAQAPARHIKMKVGQVKQAWRNNVVALGLAQGFIEPLEATALHLVMETLGLFLQGFRDGNYTHADLETFNQSINQRYQGIRDYIVCHYKVNTRSDTAYWRDCANLSSLSDNLKAVLGAWDAGKDITPILTERKMTQYYPVISWYCLLAGYGRFSRETTEQTNTDHNFERMQAYLQKTAMQFNSHEHLLKMNT